MGAIAAPKTVKLVSGLPKTRSGKVLRKTIRQIADHVPYEVPATVEDPKILEEFEEALERAGSARG